MAFITEADVEAELLKQLESLGYTRLADAEIGPDGNAPEREAYADVVLVKRLTAAIEKLNPTIPAEARGDALRKVLATEKPSLVEEKRRRGRRSDALSAFDKERRNPGQIVEGERRFGRGCRGQAGE